MTTLAMAIHGLLDALDLHQVDSGADNHAVYKTTSFFIGCVRVHSAPPLSARHRGLTGNDQNVSNYQRKGTPKSWKAGCVKDGQGPFDSCTMVMLSCPAPISPL